jgi:hypothetical protein
MHLERRAMLVILHYEYFFSSGERGLQLAYVLNEHVFG